MKPVAVNGDIWTVNRVSPGDPLLVDRTGTLRIATTDPVTMSINVSNSVAPPLLDMVILHEVAHVISISHGLLPVLRYNIPVSLQVFVEEWSAEFLERYAIEAIAIASESLGRPLCINGYCS